MNAEEADAFVHAVARDWRTAPLSKQDGALCEFASKLTLTPSQMCRDDLEILRLHGRRGWKQKSGYHVRSLAETAMFRLKTIFGDELSTRLIETQTTQTFIRCAALNKMTHLGMPHAYKVA